MSFKPNFIFVRKKLTNPFTYAGVEGGEARGKGCRRE